MRRSVDTIVAAAAPLAITALAASVRIIGIGDRTLWGDELYSLSAAVKPLASILSPQFVDNGNMLLFYVAAHLWLGVAPAAAPINEALLRLLPMFCSVATIPVAYSIARHVATDLRLRTPYDCALPIVAASVLALHPFAVQYAQEYRAYSMQLLLLALGTLVALRAARSERSVRWWIAYGTLAALAAYAHMLAAIFVAAQVGALVAVTLSIGRRRIALAAIAGGAWCLAALLPLLATVARAGAGQISWIMPLAPERIASTVGNLAGAPAETVSIVTGASLLVALIPATIGTVLVGARWRTAPTSVAIACAPLVLVPIAFLAVSAVVTSIWVTRYMHQLLLPMTLVTSLGWLALFHDIEQSLAKARRWRAALGALALVASIAMPLATLASTLQRAPEQDWRAPIAAIDAACPEGTYRVLIAPTWTHPALERVMAGYGLRIDALTDEPEEITMPTDAPLCIIVYRFVDASARIDALVGSASSTRGAPKISPSSDGYSAIYRFPAPSDPLP